MDNDNESILSVDTDVTAAVAMGEAVNRLHDNPDFQKVFLEGYFQDEAARLVSIMALPGQEPHRAKIIGDAMAISGVQVYLHTIMQLHKSAVDPVMSDEEEREFAEANT